MANQQGVQSLTHWDQEIVMSLIVRTLIKEGGSCGSHIRVH